MTAMNEAYMKLSQEEKWQLYLQAKADEEKLPPIPFYIPPPYDPLWPDGTPRIWPDGTPRKARSDTDEYGPGADHYEALLRTYRSETTMAIIIVLFLAVGAMIHGGAMTGLYN